MFQNKQKAVTENSDKYEIIKEELGYDDADIRALANSVNMKVIGLFGDEKEKKISYLMKERENRDKRNLTEMKGSLDRRYLDKELLKKWDDFVLRFSANENFLQFLDEDKRINSVVRYLVKYMDLIGSDLDRLKVIVDKIYLVSRSGNNRSIDQLYDARLVYGDNIEMFKLIADYLSNHDILHISPLFEAKVIFGNDVKMLKDFLDFLDISPGYSNTMQLDQLIAVSQIYGHDRKLFQIFVDSVKGGAYLKPDLLIEYRDLFTFNGIANYEMLKQAIFILSKLTDKQLKLLFGAKDKFGNDPEKFKIIAETFRGEYGYGDRSDQEEKFMKVLIAADHFKNDNKRLQQLVEVPDFVENIIALEDLYGNDADMFGKLVEISKKYGKEGFEAVDKGLEVYGRKYEYFKLFVETVYDQGVPAANQLLTAVDLIHNDSGYIPLFEEVIKSANGTSGEHAARAVKMLTEAGAVYGGDHQMFAIFAELAKEDRGYLCSAFFECRALYGHDLQKARVVKNKLIEVWKKYSFYVTEPLANAKKIFGNNMEKFEKVLGIIEDFAEKHPKTVYEFGFYIESCGSSMEMLEDYVDKFIDEGHEWMSPLSGLTRMYGEDVEKRNEVLSLLKRMGETVDKNIMENIRWVGPVFKVNDEESLMELVSLMERVLDKAGDTFVSNLSRIVWMCHGNKEMVKAFFDFALAKGAVGFRALYDLHPVYENNDKRFWEIVGLIKEFGFEVKGIFSTIMYDKKNVDKFDRFIQLIREKGIEVCRVLVDARENYDNNPKLFQLFYEFCMQGYHEYLSTMLSENDFKKIFIEACSQNVVDVGLNVDVKAFFKKIAEDMLGQSYCGKLWYKNIFIIAALVKQIDDSSQEAKKILDMQGQINVNAVMAKIDSHFEPFELVEDDVNNKFRLLSLYADFLKEFNGTLVPTVWYLYCLLKDPSLASSMSNASELNSIREIENIADSDDLKKKIKEIKEGILLGDVDMEQYGQSDLALAVLDDMAKVSASDWKRANRPLRSIVESYEKNEDDIIKNFDPLKYKSGFIPVQEVTESLKRDPALTDEIAKVQESIKRFIGEEGILMGERQVLEIIKDIFNRKAGDVKHKALTALKNGKSAQGELLSEKGRGFIQKSMSQIDELVEKAIKIESLEELVHLFLNQKTGSLDLESEVRAIFYYFGAKRQNLAQGESWINVDPSLVEAGKLGEFLSDTILLEVVQGKSGDAGADITLDKNERKALKRTFIGLLNFLNQKQEEEKAYKERVSTNVKNIAVLAGRGLLAELSGFYCDACWTVQSDILHNNPTMVAHTFVEEFENKEKSKIIGGCLTLESSIDIRDKKNGKEESAKVLVVRGLNPQNAYINKYKVDDFVESFLDYVQESARKLGAEYVVLPLYNVGALSNRPQILDYLRGKYGDAERVSLKDDIRFNSYAIKDSCIVVRTIKENARKGKLPKPSNVPLEQQDRWIGSW